MTLIDKTKIIRTLLSPPSLSPSPFMQEMVTGPERQRRKERIQRIQRQTIMRQQKQRQRLILLILRGMSLVS